MLQVSDLSVSFGAVRAVIDLSIEVDRGEVVGLIGPNGSGKSTFMNAVTGVVDASGRVSLDGNQLPLGRPYEIRRSGIARTFQSPQVYTALSCLENVLLGLSDRTATSLTAAWFRRRHLARVEQERWDIALASLERVGMAELAETSAEGLSYGQRRLLELARVMAGEPTFVLLDEPAAGLNDAETEHLVQLLVQLRARGVGLLVAEHKIPFIDAVCNRLVVVAQGALIASGKPDQMWEDERVQSAYLGVN